MKKSKCKYLNQLRTYSGIFYLCSGTWFLSQLIQLNILKPTYQWLIVWGVVLAGAVIAYFLYTSGRKTFSKALGNGMAILLGVCFLIGASGLNIVNSLIRDVTEEEVQKKDISLIVLQDSHMEKVQDIEESDLIGIQQVIYKDSAGKMLEKLGAELGFSNQTKEFANMNEMISGLYDKKVPVIILDESYRQVVELEWENFSKETRVLYTIDYEQELVNFAKNIDVTQDSFVTLISGIDTFGEISGVSRTDVNILAVVNPQKAKILLVNIPRDYYVPIYSGGQSIAGTDGSMDKLTHSGLFGPECTVQTLEKLFEVPINYYVRVNFTSVINVIDALGGITIHSEYAFDDFKVGENVCDGEKALQFVRERYAFEDGDRQRGKNQMAIIEAVIQKITNPSLQYDYLQLFNATRSCVEMNFAENEVKELMQMQVNSRPVWTVESISVNGTDGEDYSYFYGSKLYVMYPDKKTVEDAKTKILECLK